MASLTGFDATNVKPAEDFGIIPAGEYQAIIVDSTMKPTKKGDGNYLELTVQIVGGPFASRKLWSRLNLDNPNAQAREIAERELSAICHAVGILKPDDSSQLHNRPLIVRVDVELADAAKGRNKDQNAIKAWKKIEGAGAPSAPPVAAATGASPWSRNAA